jgi:hypothetical protein
MQIYSLVQDINREQADPGTAAHSNNAIKTCALRGGPALGCRTEADLAKVRERPKGSWRMLEDGLNHRMHPGDGRPTS